MMLTLCSSSYVSIPARLGCLLRAQPRTTMDRTRAR